MTDAEFHDAIRRVRRWHWLHYLLQALLMLGVVAAMGSQLQPQAARQPQAPSGLALGLLGALVPVVGGILYLVDRRLRPNLRRLAEENLRIYKGRVFLRDSLLGLLGLPFLVSYFLTRGVLELVACGFLLVVLCLVTAPSAKTYQRWLLS
ncbi:hypothetical protein GCM10027346_30850 [Hymenobacter seoulensis]